MVSADTSRVRLIAGRRIEEREKKKLKWSVTQHNLLKKKEQLCFLCVFHKNQVHETPSR